MNIETGKTASTFASLRRDKRLGSLVPNPNAKLKEQFHEVARFKYLSKRTEETYWQWVVRFLKFHRKKSTPQPRPQSPSPSPIRRAAPFNVEAAKVLAKAAKKPFLRVPLRKPWRPLR